MVGFELRTLGFCSANLLHGLLLRCANTLGQRFPRISHFRTQRSILDTGIETKEARRSASARDRKTGPRDRTSRVSPPKARPGNPDPLWQAADGNGPSRGADASSAPGERVRRPRVSFALRRPKRHTAERRPSTSSRSVGRVNADFHRGQRATGKARGRRASDTVHVCDTRQGSDGVSSSSAQNVAQRGKPSVHWCPRAFCLIHRLRHSTFLFNQRYNPMAIIRRRQTCILPAPLRYTDCSHHAQ